MDQLVRLVRLVLRVTVVDKDGAAAGAAAGVHVAPTVADEIARGEVDPVPGGGLEDHPRLGLAAGAIVGVGVEADDDIVDRQLPHDFRVHRFDRRLRRQSVGDVGLIGDDDQDEARLLKEASSLGNPRQNAEVRKVRRRYWLAVALQVGVDDAVAVEEDGAYHLVAFFCSLGCETRQCHTTAWNASDSGVTQAGFTCGMTTTTSPCRAVYPVSLPTIPNTLAARFFARSIALTRLVLTLRSASPPPTENIRIASSPSSRLVSSQAAKTLSQPSSLVRAVNSETLSIGL